MKGVLELTDARIMLRLPSYGSSKLPALQIRQLRQHDTVDPKLYWGCKRLARI